MKVLSDLRLGFSLAECLIALTLAMILAFFSFSTLGHFITQADDQHLMTLLTQAIEYAEASSLTQHTTTILCGSQDGVTCVDNWSSGFLVRSDDERNQKRVLAAYQFKKLNGVLHWRSFPAYRDYLVFASNGMLHVDNATFWYCHANEPVPAFAFSLSKTGRVRLISHKKRDLGC